jgi:hypothetical protein
MAGLSKSAVIIKAKSRDRRKRGIPALIYTKFGTIYTILGIASGLTGRQAGRGSWPACWDHWRCVYRATEGRCGAMLDTLFNERLACTKIQSEALIERLRDVAVRCSIRSLIRGRHALGQSEALTDKRKPTSIAKLRIDLAYLLSDPKYSNTLPLRLRAACAPHALHPVNEFDAPSVRNNTKPRNTRVQPP